METILRNEDITLLYVEAASFPDGIMAAHEKLLSLIPFSTDRKYFGVSRPEDGEIRYKAAAEQMLSVEAGEFGCKTLVLQQGNYICLTIHDYMKDLSGIGAAFQELPSYPGLDPQGYCVEWYVSDKEVKCMIRLEGE